MQGSRQLCVLINGSGSFIYSLLTPIPRRFISCGQSLNAFRVHASVMASTSGSDPLAPVFPGTRAFSEPLLTSQRVRSAPLWQGLGPSAPMACPSGLPRGLPLQQPRWAPGKKLPGARARAACTADRLRLWIPQAWTQVPGQTLPRRVVLGQAI